MKEELSNLERKLTENSEMLFGGQQSLSPKEKMDLQKERNNIMMRIEQIKKETKKKWSWFK